MYVNRTGCAWRYLPADFPAWRTVYGYFAAWRDNGTLQRLHDRLRDQARIAPGRDPRPTAAVLLHRIRLAWAGSGYAAGKLAAWAATLKIQLEIVRKRDPHTFEVLPRRWVVERTLAWITAHRRCARDYERLPGSHEAMVLWAMTALMTQRLAAQTPRPD